MLVAGAANAEPNAQAVAAAADTPAAQPAPAAPFEVGVFGGLLFPPRDHVLFDRAKQFQNYEAVAPEFGVRGAYLPIPYFGLEGEGAFAPSATVTGRGAKLFALRAHALGQLPLGGVTPFVLLGVGSQFTAGRALGADADLALHFGGGLKVRLDDVLGLRFDVRDSVHWDNESHATHYPEVLLGLGFALGAEEPAPVVLPPADADGDGLADAADQCPSEAANTPTGCPVRDADGDYVADADDKCPAEAGTLPDGCPDLDTDKDGVPLPADKCPEAAGVAPEGCPDPDADKDGVNLPVDTCPDQPETVNGFDDKDGCPDQLPEKVKQFTGVIQGIEFDFGKSTIRPQSLPVLDATVAVLQEFAALRVRVTGHTDAVGSRDKNVERSAARADAVKQYLVQHGIAADRIETRGAGPDEPLADNATEAGRQKNRRIEFAVIQ